MTGPRRRSSLAWLLAVRVMVAGLLGAGFLTACQLAPGPLPVRGDGALGLSPASAPVFAVAESAAAVTRVADLAVPEPATLRMSVRWPVVRDPYRIAVLPTSVRRLVVQVLAGDEELAREEVARSGESAEFTFRLLPRDNVRVEIEALGSPLPEEATDVPVARGSVSGLNLVSSKLVTARITLVPVDQPILTRLSRNIGQPGTVLEVYGRNFRPDTQVFFGGVAAGPVTWISAGDFRVTVPDAAVSGRLEVLTDGVPVPSEAWFWVLESLGLAVPPRESWDDGTLAYARKARFGSDVVLEARPVWRVADPAATASVPAPEEVTWLSSDDRAGSFVAPGRFRCGNEKVSTTVVAALGPYMSGGYRIEPAGSLTGLRLSVDHLDLFSLPEVGTPSPEFATTAQVQAVVDHTLPRTPAIACSSSDPGLLTCADGLIATTREQRDGQAVVTVWLADVPEMRATMSVRVHASGSMQVVIE